MATSKASPEALRLKLDRSFLRNVYPGLKLTQYEPGSLEVFTNGDVTFGQRTGKLDVQHRSIRASRMHVEAYDTAVEAVSYSHDGSIVYAALLDVWGAE